MPSLFSKIRHRKTGSTSSVGSNSSSTAPASPSTPSRSTFQQSQPQQQQRQSTSGDTPARASPSEQTQSTPPPTARTDPEIGSDVVVIDKSLPPAPADQRDATGHSAPFVDESERPGLPTTSSNVHNPIPVPSSQTASNHQTTHYAEQPTEAKPLPSVPEVQTPGATENFPNPQTFGEGTPRRLSEAGGGPPVPPRSPIRSSISVDRNDAASPPPLPHVTSTARDHLSPTDRPEIIPSASRPLRPSERDNPRVAGEFPHADSVASPTKPMGPRDARSTGNGAGNQIPHGPSSWSLRENAEAAEAYLSQNRRTSSTSSYSDDEGRGKGAIATSAGTATATGGALPKSSANRGYQQDQTLPDKQHNLREDLRSTYHDDQPSREHITDHLSRIAARTAPDAISARRKEEYGDITMPPGTHPQLESDRAEFASRVLDEAEGRTRGKNELSQVGQRAFRAMGMEDKLGMGNTVDVDTKWLEPVVQETVRRTEHTEYMTIIDREVHKYHVYPKIQPIYDPNPSVLETRHRIFSQADGKWHEVVGDAAAIEILGQDVFRNGPKERREERKLALPPLTSDGTEGQQGLEGKMQSLSLSSRDGGVGRGQGGVYEREYPLGGKVSEWKEVAKGALHHGSATEAASGQREVNNRDSVGVAL